MPIVLKIVCAHQFTIIMKSSTLLITIMHVLLHFLFIRRSRDSFIKLSRVLLHYSVSERLVIFTSVSFGDLQNIKTPKDKVTTFLSSSFSSSSRTSNLRILIKASNPKISAMSRTLPTPNPAVAVPHVAALDEHH